MPDSLETAGAERVSTGLAGLDHVLDGLRTGDNVVWRVDDIEDYRGFVEPFVARAIADGRAIVYLRFGRHPPLVAPGPGIKIVSIDALRGFEAFIRRVYQLITDHGRGAFYVFDCLSDLLSAWATDLMVGNLFQVICPYLYRRDTVAYFGLLSGDHCHATMARIRETTRVLIDVRRGDNACYVQPVKVCQRQSPTMFLPHAHEGGAFRPVIDSSAATRVYADLARRHNRTAHRQLDTWDHLFLDAAQALNRTDDAEHCSEVRERLYSVLISRDARVIALARRYLDIPDLLEIRARMIGSGYIGGKAVGMLLARKVLLQDDPERWGRHLEPHDSFFVGSDVYYSYLVHNGWWPRVMRQRTEAGYFSEARSLREDMRGGRLPDEVRAQLERMLDDFGQYPILVRSSSLLEDGFGNAFAGKYESLFLVNQGSPEQRLAQLEEAICRVFASTMSEDALTYRRQRGLADLEEPMALLLQRVCGRYHGRWYFPDAAGVGVSRNTFVWEESMEPSAGMVRLVMGLGTRAVDRIDGDHACVVALDQPHKRPFRDRDDAARFSQHDVDVLDISDNRPRTLALRHLTDAAELPLRWCGEIDREAMQRARAGSPSVWRLTFTPLLRETAFVPLMQQLLRTLETAYAYPVDVEFTLHLTNDGTPSFSLVQCRPLQTLGLSPRVELPRKVPSRRLFFATDGHFMGGNIDQPLARVIHVDGPRYSALTSVQKFAVARLVGHLNRRISDRDTCPTLLIGPGRWGSSTPELGVPIRFADISRVAVIAEVADLGDGMVPDLSFGSHFFQDLVESRIAYVALFPTGNGARYNPGWLSALPASSRIPLDLDDPPDNAVAQALTVYDVHDTGLRVVADVLRQRLVCYQAQG
ncbi:PEP/pyruvate-binding domain-containing protein [Thiocapsa bogorovii]|uniref:PEP/pyruvate-binding domain-containing protein n=1 Tax=Thiocapsa bogorovii TaxID=521689 RepID=UPI001E54AA55|nr:PEP/pyruvate-binding domain-containing protein [Thiocapsa bogorovii]UHD18881.1 PEP/pyruvate-binding domain-containing protein [Thiocapsa bogorovii]